MTPDRDRKTSRQQWPHPADTPLQRARRIALAYRQHLKAANPDLCAALDDMAVAFGETWAAETVVTTPTDALLTTAEAADLAGVDQETISQWRKRGYVSRSGAREKLQKRGINDRGWPLFRASEVLEIAATTRAKRLRRGAP